MNSTPMIPKFDIEKFYGEGKITYLDGSIYEGEISSGKKMVLVFIKKRMRLKMVFGNLINLLGQNLFQISLGFGIKKRMDILLKNI